MSRSVISRALPLAAMLVLPAVAFAQSGRIVGRMSDAQRSAVAGVQIIASPAGLAATSAEDGRFTVRGVPAGTYVVRVYRFGYKARTIAA